MGTKALSPECQIHGLERISEPLGRAEKVWQSRNRLKHIAKRRWTYLVNWFSQIVGRRATASNLRTSTVADGLQAGDRVRVKSREDIQASLNRWNRLKGCDIMEEMWQYCGTTQRVLRPVRKFLDERDYRVKRCNGIVLLEGLICQGTIDYGPCDRSCHYFWREEWLEKIG